MTHEKMPEALRLAEWIESDMTCQGDAEISAELRRQHAEIQRLRAVIELVNTTKAKRWHPCDPVKHAISDALQSTKEQP